MVCFFYRRVFCFLLEFSFVNQKRAKAGENLLIGHGADGAARCFLAFYVANPVEHQALSLFTEVPCLSVPPTQA